MGYTERAFAVDGGALWDMRGGNRDADGAPSEPDVGFDDVRQLLEHVLTAAGKRNVSKKDFDKYFSLSDAPACVRRWATKESWPKLVFDVVMGQFSTVAVARYDYIVVNHAIFVMRVVVVRKSEPRGRDV